MAISPLPSEGSYPRVADRWCTTGDRCQFKEFTGAVAHGGGVVSGRESGGELLRVVGFELLGVPVDRTYPGSKFVS